MANNSGFSEKEKITISGSQSVRSTKVPVVPFLEQHSRKIQIRLQHMNLKSAQVNIKNIAKGTTDPRVEFCLPK